MADAPALTTYVTEADLDALGSDARVEIVNGEIVEMSPVGALHHIVGGNIHDLLKAHVKANRLGWVFMDGVIYYLKHDGPRLYQARVPDVSFVRRESIPGNWNIEKPLPIAPTLAVEVMSPDDKIEEVIEKVGEYLDAGTEQVWVVFPRAKEVQQYRRGDSQVHLYRTGDSIDVTALFPGLSLSLVEIFDTSG
jgi:Uma2 family endonuclease